MTWRCVLSAAVAVAALVTSSPQARGQGAAYAWGRNNVGQLGDGTTTNRSTPVPVVGMGSGVTAVSGGRLHSLAVRNGAALAWGGNELGQLGNGTFGGFPGFISTPVQVGGALAGLTVTQVAAGERHSLALTDTGRLFAWGDNDFGQLGNGTTVDSPIPVEVFAPAGFYWAAVEAGGSHTVAVLAPVPEPAGLLAIAALAAAAAAGLRRHGVSHRAEWERRLSPGQGGRRRVRPLGPAETAWASHPQPKWLRADPSPCPGSASGVSARRRPNHGAQLRGCGRVAIAGRCRPNWSLQLRATPIPAAAGVAGSTCATARLSSVVRRRRPAQCEGGLTTVMTRFEMSRGDDSWRSTDLDARQPHSLNDHLTRRHKPWPTEDPS